MYIWAVPMPDGFVRLVVDGEQATLTIDREEKRNALRTQDWQDLAGYLSELGEMESVRVVIVRGEGPNFCAGSDLTELAERSAYDAYRNAIRIQRVSTLIAGLRKPTIACMRGHAVAGGLEFALACTFRIAGTSVKLALPEVTLGTLPGAGGTQRILALAPRPVALRMLLLGDSLDAEAGLAANLLDLVVDDADVESQAQAIAHRLTAFDSQAVSLLLDCVAVACEAPLQRGLMAEAALFGLTLTSSTYRERIKTFMASRVGPLTDSDAGQERVDGCA